MRRQHPAAAALQPPCSVCHRKGPLLCPSCANGFVYTEETRRLVDLLRQRDALYAAIEQQLAARVSPPTHPFPSPPPPLLPPCQTPHSTLQLNT
jgi:hypothetical protein